jgi:hypothetical protein
MENGKSVDMVRVRARMIADEAHPEKQYLIRPYEILQERWTRVEDTGCPGKIDSGKKFRFPSHEVTSAATDCDYSMWKAR